MLRLVLMVLRLWYKLPYWFIKLKQLENFDKYDVETRYEYIRKLVADLIARARVDVVCTGTENLPEQSGYMIAPNHQGLFDPLIVAHTHVKPATAVVKKELVKYPLVGNVIKICPAIAMDRENIRQSIKVIHQAGNEIAEGRNYLIFAEGTRSKKGNQTNEFKGGTFKAATDHQAPIVPVALVDCFKAFDSTSYKRVTCQIHYLEPIYYDEYKDMTSIEIAKTVRERVQNKIDECVQAKAEN